MSQGPSKTLQVRLRRSEWEMLRDLADSKGTSVSRLVRDTVVGEREAEPVLADRIEVIEKQVKMILRRLKKASI